MTDEKLDQILKQALSPKIDNSEIQIQRKAKHMNKKKIIARGLAACAAVALVVTAIHFNGGAKPNADSKPAADNVTNNSEEKNPITNNLFAITAYAAELPEGTVSGDVIGLRTLDAGYGSSAFLDNRFTISGENITKIKITTDKCNLYSAISIYEGDPEYTDAKNAEANVNEDEYMMIADVASDFDEDADKPLKYHYDHLTIEGTSYEGDYDNRISFGMSVPEELRSANDDMQTAYHEDVDQVNGATLTIEVTFNDGSTKTHHYKLETGKIFVPSDENGYLQWDNLTRFVSSEEESYAYGYLMKKID